MVTLKDISVATGVSVSTVSKALKNSYEISDATIALVNETASRLGYTRKKRVRMPAMTIGVTMPEVRSHYYAEFFHALSEELYRYGYSTISSVYQNFNEEELHVVKNMFKQKIDGIIICCSEKNSEEISQYVLTSEIPAVLHLESSPPYGINSVYIRSDTGIDQAIDHLLELGHKKIGYLGEYKSDSRYNLFCNSMKQRDMEVDPRFVKRGSERFENGGYLRAKELLEEKDLPTAIFSSYDQLAYGAMCAFRENGINVPQDISIIGFDNIVMDDYYPIPFTTIANPVEQMGTISVKILLDAIRNPEQFVPQSIAHCKVG